MREWGGDAAGVRSGLSGLENKEKEGGEDKGSEEGDGEGTERGASRASSRKSRERGSAKGKGKIAETGGTESPEVDDGAMDGAPFYRAVEDAYAYANRTLLRVLMEDQMLIPRLR